MTTLVDSFLYVIVKMRQTFTAILYKNLLCHVHHGNKTVQYSKVSCVVVLPRYEEVYEHTYLPGKVS